MLLCMPKWHMPRQKQTHGIDLQLDDCYVPTRSNFTLFALSQLQSRGFPSLRGNR